MERAPGPTLGGPDGPASAFAFESRVGVAVHVTRWIPGGTNFVPANLRVTWNLSEVIRWGFWSCKDGDLRSVDTVLAAFGQIAEDEEASCFPQCSGLIRRDIRHSLPL